jgi:multiple sugar transport system substrate-binding protein
MFKRNTLSVLILVAALFAVSLPRVQAQNPTNVNFFHTIPPDSEANVKTNLLPNFEKANPTCKVTLRNLGVEGGDSAALTKSALAAKDESSPSLMWEASASAGDYVKADVLADTQKFFDDNPKIKDNVIDSLITLSTYQGKIRSIPMTTNNVAVYVNVTAFKAAGVAVPSQDPEKTWTWEEFRAASKKVSEAGKMKGLLFSDSGGWASWLASGWLAQAGGFYINTNSEIGFNKPEAIEAYKFLKTLVDDKSTVFSEPGKGWDPAPWLSQKAAMTINGPWNLSALLKVKDFEWTVVPLPRGKKIAAPLGGNQLYVFNLTPAKNDCAFKFAAYVLSDEFQVKFTIKDGSLPTTKSASNSPEYLEFAKNTPALAGWANQTKYGVARPAMPGFNAVGDGPFGKAWGDIFVQGADIQSSMDKAAKEAALLLSEAK